MMQKHARPGVHPGVASGGCIRVSHPGAPPLIAARYSILTLMHTISANAISIPAILLFIAVGAAAQEAPTFHGGVTLVHVDAEVLAADGRVVTGLSRADFRVFDEGQEQSLVAFAADEQSLDLTLLLDSSGSMRRALTRVRGAAESSLANLRRGDRLSLMIFSDEAREIVPLTEDRDAIRNALDLLLSSHSFGHGGTRIQDAVDTAARQFSWRHEPVRRRRTILVITDNRGRPARNEKLVIRDFWEADAVLSGLITPSPAAIAEFLGGHVPGGIQHIVGATGGDFIRTEDLAAALPEMMRRIRTRYGLYYALPEGKPGQMRHIRVELADAVQSRIPGVHARARQGYLWGAPNPDDLVQ